MSTFHNSLNGSLLLLGSILLLSACSAAKPYQGTAVLVNPPNDGRVTSQDLGSFDSLLDCYDFGEEAILLAKARHRRKHLTTFPEIAIECREVR